MVSGVIYIVLTLTLLKGAQALWCYQCDSSMSGCGESLDVIIQKWKECPNTGTQMCAKVVETQGTTNHITRGCVSALLQSTEYRMDMPTVKRHNYCDPGRDTPLAQKYSDGTGRSADDSKKRIYCFCNDWNGCNPASLLTAHPIISVLLVLVSATLARWLS